MIWNLAKTYLQSCQYTSMVREEVPTYASKAMHIMAWMQAVTKKKRAHFDDRNDMMLFRGPDLRAGTIPSLSRYPPVKSPGLGTSYVC